VTGRSLVFKEGWVLWRFVSMVTNSCHDKFDQLPVCFLKQVVSLNRLSKVKLVDSILSQVQYVRVTFPRFIAYLTEEVN
jgi:hypothetical protein